jgi:hypothetical protein
MLTFIKHNALALCATAGACALLTVCGSVSNASHLVSLGVCAALATCAVVVCSLVAE